MICDLSRVFFLEEEDFLIFLFLPDFIGIRREIPADAVGAVLAPLRALAERIEVARIDFVSHWGISFPFGTLIITWGSLFVKSFRENSFKNFYSFFCIKIR